ncbi:MAG: LuxR C-terminal-related transcriptional regulator [Solirubrobacteraceae bacterium]
MPATKFVVPDARAEHLLRERQLQLIDPRARLLLVSAPTGYGKTTLVSQWIARDRERQPVWIQLTGGDDGPFAFWIAVLSALAAAVPGLGELSLRALASPLWLPGQYEGLERRSAGGQGSTGAPAEPLPEVPEAVLTPLVADLEAYGRPLGLVLDDFHCIQDPVCQTTLAWLVKHAPPNLLIAIVTRRDPALPLGRMRARGEVCELRADDLRFDAAEVAVFMNGQLELGLDAHALEVLTARTEGWPAGLYLAALAMRGSSDAAAFVAAFGGDDHLVVDYLGPEVLMSLEPALLTFLLRTSVPTRFCASLCDAVVGVGPPAHEILAELERSNLFLVPLDRQHEWYRYHHLFRELLAAELMRREPALPVELHRRAAAWHREQGDAPEAIEHALAAGELTQSAADIATVAISMHNSAAWPTVERWLTQVPEDVVPFVPGFAVAKAWMSGALGLRDEVTRLAAIAREHDNGAPLPDGTSSVEVALCLLDAIWPFGDVERARDGALRAQFDTSEINAVTVPFALGYTGFWSAVPDDEVTEPLERAVQIGSSHRRDDAVVAAALAHLAYLALLREDRERARAHVGDALQVMSEAMITEHVRSCQVRIALGWLLLADGEPADAECELQRSLELARRYRSPLDVGNALRLLAECRDAVRDPAGAAIYLDEAWTVMETQCADPGRLRELINHAGVQLRHHPRPLGAGPADPDVSLTDRELQVLRLLAGTMSLPEIADELFISHNTAKTHCKSIYRKLGIVGRSQVAARARELNLR